VACSIADPLGCLDSAAKSVAGDAFASIAHDFGTVADSAINWLWAQISSAAAVSLGGPGFNLDFGIVAAIAATVAVGLFVIQVTTSTVRRDPNGLARAVKGLFVAFIGGGVAIGATNLVLTAVDALSAGVVQLATGQSIDQMGQSILAAGAITGATGNPAGIILLSLAALVAVIVVWAALVVRKLLIVVSAVFAPLAFAGSLADITVSWTRRWVETMIALIISKLILVIIFVVGLGILTQGVGQAGTGTTQAITQVVSGILVLSLAGFAPWLALKLVHFSGDQFHQLHALAGTATSGAQAAAAAPQKAAAWKATAAGLGASATRFGGGGPRGGAPAGSGMPGSSGKGSQPPSPANGASGTGPDGAGPPAARPAGGTTGPAASATNPMPGGQPAPLSEAPATGVPPRTATRVPS
jgi:type IV secretion system protein TrbL